MNRSQRGLFSSNATTEEENDELYSNMKQAFDLLDTDRSGFLDKNEVRDAMRALGITTDEKQVELFFKDYDKNEDEKIDYEEFKEMLTKRIYKREPVDDVFDYFQPKDNKIEIEDLRRVAKKHFKYITEEEIKDMFGFATGDGTQWLCNSILTPRHVLHFHLNALITSRASSFGQTTGNVINITLSRSLRSMCQTHLQGVRDPYVETTEALRLREFILTRYRFK